MTDITLFEGSDKDFRVTFSTGELDPGWTSVEVYGVNPELEDYLSVVLGTGEAIGRIEWSETLPVGVVLEFRLRFSDGVTRTSTRPIGVYIK